MKVPTTVVIVKCCCYMFIGGLTPLAASLAQWANSGESPPKIVWVVIMAGCGVGAATQLLAFLSSAYSDYKEAARTAVGGDTTVHQVTETTQTTDKPVPAESVAPPK